jgi:YebC/PmpR family DNA-binding regulatory protein
MAGHSQFKNIMYRKGAQDAKRAKMFAKITREIMVAVKSGLPDQNSNPRLRAALAMARSANMPKDNIDRAMKRAMGGDEGVNYEEIRYEGYGPGGTALIVEVLTDNRNRTASEVRSAFSKHGGNLGETGSVGFMFERIGVIRLLKQVNSFDQIFETAVEAGADNVEELDDQFEITTSIDEFGAVRDAITQLYEVIEAKIVWRPLNTVACDEETAHKVFKLIDVLEDNDDVQNVYSNFEVSEEILERLTA